MSIWSASFRGYLLLSFKNSEWARSEWAQPQGVLKMKNVESACTFWKMLALFKKMLHFIWNKTPLRGSVTLSSKVVLGSTAQSIGRAGMFCQFYGMCIFQFLEILTETVTDLRRIDSFVKTNLPWIHLIINNFTWQSNPKLTQVTSVWFKG